MSKKKHLDFFFCWQARMSRDKDRTIKRKLHKNKQKQKEQKTSKEIIVKKKGKINGLCPLPRPTLSRRDRATSHNSFTLKLPQFPQPIVACI